MLLTSLLAPPRSRFWYLTSLLCLEEKKEEERREEEDGWMDVCVSIMMIPIILRKRYGLLFLVLCLASFSRSHCFPWSVDRVGRYLVHSGLGSVWFGLGERAVQ